MPLFQNGKRNLTERKKTGFFAVQIAFKMQKLVSPETGDEFESDDVVGGSTVFSAFRGFSRVWLLLIRFKIENNVRK